ncbi:MAG: arsenite/tail-anchored protein-transporting ATPase [Acidimicrobiaceae bacterium]|nr:arsenite/tail-anchored protein-transporting ATPase [Acidimicrobiaceae bacterium]
MTGQGQGRDRDPGRDPAPVPCRVLLFTGKGGVGKTSVAAATALRCADSGLRTLVLSTDSAHSLSDAFDTHLDGRPRPVCEGLWGQQLDATERLEDAWGDIQDYLRDLFGWAGVDSLEAEELSVLPGLEEVFALADIKGHADSGDWDVVVVDCAPTAETIRLLSLPEILAWYMDRVFPVERRVLQAVRPILRHLTSIPVAGDHVFAAARRLYDGLEGVRDLLTDGERSTIRLVVNPEKIVIAEARRTATYLSLFGYRVDAVVANRLLPEAITDPWFKSWKEAHAEHLATIEEGFAPLPVLKAELATDELVGLDRLRDFAGVVYGDLDPTGILHRGEPLRVEARDDALVLRLELPFADRDDLDVGRRDGELLVRVGPHRRAIMLPDSLRRRQVVGATMVSSWLEVSFAEATAEPVGGMV